MKDEDIDPKQKAILDAAWAAFAAYGLRKTSMDDIARGAGMSRAAMYLHYRNKDDIFQTLVRYCYDKCSAALARGLIRNGAVSDVLEAAILAQGEVVVQPMLSSAHGMELMEAGNTTASDPAREGEARLHRIYADWLTRHVEAGTVALPGSADDMATLILTSLKGLKASVTTYDEYCRAVRLFAAVFGAGITR